MKTREFKIWLSKKRAMLLTLLGSPRGFFIQYAYMDSVVPQMEYPAVRELCESTDLKPVFDSMAQMADVIRRDPEFWNKETRHLGLLDSAVNYAVTSIIRPRRILEIGCGRSTEILARAVLDNRLDTRITCIDPEPRLDITGLPVDFEKRVLQVSDAKLVATLQRDDILYIDSSHILQPGSDVDIEFNILFPVLQSGVIVHVHDIHLPWGYDPSWQNKEWNEVCGLMPWMLSGAFEIVFPVRYAQVVHDRDLRSALPEHFAGHTLSGGSIWLRKT